MSAILVRQPLALLLAVVQIEHGSHRIHPDTIHMELPEPEQNIGNQEIFHLRLAVVEKRLSGTWDGCMISAST